MGSVQADSFYPITGIQEGLDPDKTKLLRKVPVRMEIDDWYQSQEPIHINQRALFFPAFLKFQRMKPQEKLSWYQIAGIHGKPFVAWDEPPQKAVTEQKGYCTHNSMLFTTWHRPYMVLWEQVIFELMKKEINSYKVQERDGLLEAAQSWRFPYWDWANKKPLPDNPLTFDYNVPLVMMKQKVRIRLPSPQNEGDIDNAFYEFRMPGDISMGDPSLEAADKDPLKDLRIVPTVSKNEKGKYSIPFDQCRATSRHAKGKGINTDWQNGKQDNVAVAKAMRDYPSKEKEKAQYGNLTASLRDAFYRITTIDKFEDFATKRFPGTGAGTGDEDKKQQKDYAFDSCESLHDNLHGWCGGGGTDVENQIMLLGHMSHVPLAAYDPIFWLHHCNIDRVIAMWQMIHETLWFNDPKDVRNEDLGTFAIKARNMDKPTDILRPFRKDLQGNYWTSNDAREPTQLGYTYEGLEKWNYTKTDGSYDKQRHIGELIKSLNLKYNSAKSAAFKSRATADPGQDDRPSLMSMNSLMKVTDWEPKDVVTDDYVVNVVYEKFALGGTTFSVHIFIGKVPVELPYTFQEPGTQVGEVINFSTEADSMGSSREGCSNCRSQQADQALATGRVILTNALITRWKKQVVHEPDSADGPQVLESMAPKDVVKFLKYNLHWRVTSLGREVPIPDGASWLTVSLAVGKAEHFVNLTKQSKFHEYKGAFQATEGKPGGAVSPNTGNMEDAAPQNAIRLYPDEDEISFEDI